ncbi:MAG: ABC transporter permease [Treponema sp.]|nr:MAG: ABC transporter permease [Treponema sp.]
MKKNKNFLEKIVSSDAALSVIVVLAGFLCGTVLILLVGKNPAGMYKAILQVTTGYSIDRGQFYIRYIGEWLAGSMPLILCGLAMAFAARVGLFNIGGEGQYIIGLTAAQFAALYLPQIGILHMIVAMLLAGFAGAIWGGIAGYLKAKREVSEVVATIMMNFIALYLSRMLTMTIPGTNTYRTPSFPKTAMLNSEFWSRVTHHSQFNNGIWFVIASVLLFWYIMNKTKTGYELRATGLNKTTAEVSGISVTKSIVLSMLISGLFAGFAGGVVSLGSFSYGRVLGGMDNYGFTGIAVALVGNNTAIGTMLSGLLFGMLSSAQPLMELNSIPKEIIYIIQGLVVIFIAIRYGLKIIILNSLKKKKSQKGVKNV